MYSSQKHQARSVEAQGRCCEARARRCGSAVERTYRTRECPVRRLLFSLTAVSKDADRKHKHQPRRWRKAGPITMRMGEVVAVRPGEPHTLLGGRGGRAGQPVAW
jgi:hypothetical protein